jgi:hypothetical protein
MRKAAKQERLDRIELQLTPKEWAVSLADEMRLHSCQADFLKAIAKGTYRGLPYVKPFYALNEQVEASVPGSTPEDVKTRNQLARQLRTEFHALKVLIATVNEIMTRKAETIGLKVALKPSTIHSMILQDAFGRTSRRADDWIKENNASKLNEEECQSLLIELAAFTIVSFAATSSDGLPLYGVRLRLHSLIEGWADETTMLIMDILAHQTAVQAIQEKYFDAHPILFRDVEAKVTKTIQTVHEAVAIFNEYLQDCAGAIPDRGLQEQHDGVSPATWDHDAHLAIDVEAIQKEAGMAADRLAEKWVRDAKDEAVADISEETGEHEDLIWQRLRQEAGLQPTARSEMRPSNAFSPVQIPRSLI